MDTTPPPADRTEAEWQDVLDEDEYHVLREQGTEPKFSGELLSMDEPGVFRCAGCGTRLFDSEHKFDSRSGWPSFYDAAASDHIETRVDRSAGMQRIEVRCAACEGHLGHIFDDGPEPTGKRYCINSVALEFEPAADGSDREN